MWMRFVFTTLLSAATLGVAWIGLLILAFKAPLQWYIDFLVDQTHIGRDPRIIEFMVSDLRDMMLQMVTVLAVAIGIAALSWLVCTVATRVEMPGQARKYWYWWFGIFLFSAGLGATAAGVISFSGDYRDILRLESRWAITAAALLAGGIVYWLVTAMWTPSLRSPAVPLSGLFRWLRRPLSL